MKKINLIVLTVFSILLTACSYKELNKIFKTDSYEEEDMQLVEKTKCPKSKIPYDTSFNLKKTVSLNFEARLRKVVTTCNFLTKGSDQLRQKIRLNFIANIEIISKRKLNKSALNELDLYIAIVSNKGRVLTKLIAPIRMSDISSKEKNIYKIFLEKNFKYSFTEKNNNFKIYYGFQKDRNNSRKGF